MSKFTVLFCDKNGRAIEPGWPGSYTSETTLQVPLAGDEVHAVTGVWQVVSRAFRYLQVKDDEVSVEAIVTCRKIKE